MVRDGEKKLEIDCFRPGDAHGNGVLNVGALDRSCAFIFHLELKINNLHGSLLN